MIECFTMWTRARCITRWSLAEKGLVRAVAQEPVARAACAPCMRIMPRGRERFQELLHAQFAAEGDLRATLYTMLFLQSCDLKIVAEASHPDRSECAAGGNKGLRRSGGRAAPAVAAS